MLWLRQIGQWLVAMVLQVLLINQLQLGGVCHPSIYILPLLMMPITLPLSVEMIIGAIAGLIMDVFCNSIGIHMAACILLMFIRPYLLGVIVNDKDRLNEQISLRNLGLEGLIKYTVILVIIHHLTVFALAAWSWSHIGMVLLETAVSSALTIVVIIGYNTLKYR